MSNVYWIEHQWLTDGNGPGTPSILAIGDSWFWYMMPGGNLLTYLGPLVERKSRVIFAVGNNGAEAIDYADGKYAKFVRRSLATYGSGLTEVFISGGGNDFAGTSDLLPLLRGDCSKAQQAEDCFLEGAGWPSLSWLMNKISISMTKLFGMIYIAAPNATIYVHNYDIPFPDGRTIFSNGEGWIRDALIRAKVPDRLQRDCVRHVLVALTLMQAALVSQSGDRVIQVNSHGVLGESDWANELHPKGSGFNKIVNQAWKPVLEENGAA